MSIDSIETKYVRDCELTGQKPRNKVDAIHIANMANSLNFVFERVGGTTITGCWAILPNGFKVGYGESSCVDPDGFDESLGRKHAQERAVQDAINKLWELEGYMLKMTGRTSDALPKCHDIRNFVGELTETARQYADTQQLRERISTLVNGFMGSNYGK